MDYCFLLLQTYWSFQLGLVLVEVLLGACLERLMSYGVEASQPQLMHDRTWGFVTVAFFILLGWALGWRVPCSAEAMPAPWLVNVGVISVHLGMACLLLLRGWRTVLAWWTCGGGLLVILVLAGFDMPLMSSHTRGLFWSGIVAALCGYTALRFVGGWRAYARLRAVSARDEP